jgi:hypothetical protein
MYHHQPSLATNFSYNHRISWMKILELLSSWMEIIHCTSIWGILLMTKNWQTDTYEIKVSQILQSDWQVRPICKGFFHGKNGPNSSDFELPESYDDFQKVAKNIEGFCFVFSFSLPSYVVCNQIWLNYILDDRQFGYYHNKILKRNPGTCH